MTSSLVLAANGDNFSRIVWIAVIIIWFFSWIMKQVAAAKQAAPSPPRRPPDERLQSEIEVFLRESDVRRDATAIEVVPEEELRRRAKSPGRPAPRQRRPNGAPRQKPPGGRKPAPALEARPQLGGGIQPQLGQEIGSRHIQSNVAANPLASGVAQSVQRHLGVARPASGRPAARRPQHPLAEQLCEPQGALKAIVLSEILKPRRGRASR